jgi:hypothetical protein
MKVAPEARRQYECEALAQTNWALTAEAKELRAAGRRRLRVALVGEFPATAITVTWHEVDGRSVTRRYPLWDDDNFGVGSDRDTPSEVGRLVSLDVYSVR